LRRRRATTARPGQFMTFSDAGVGSSFFKKDKNWK
jgi:hypothetical protein